MFNALCIRLLRLKKILNYRVNSDILLSALCNISMSKSRGICFDLDGTLLDSTKNGPDRFLKVSQKLGLPIKPDTKELVISFWHKPADILITSVWPNMDPQIFINEWKKLEINELLPIIPDAITALRLLSEEFSLSILTNRDRISTDFQIHHFRYLFDFIITHDDVPVMSDRARSYKPDPGTMNQIIGEYKERGINKNRIIYIGDQIEADFELAQKTGISFYAVTSGVCSFKDFLAAGVRQERIISSITELPRLLLY